MIPLIIINALRDPTLELHDGNGTFIDSNYNSQHPGSGDHCDHDRAAERLGICHRLFARSLAATPDQRWEMNVNFLRSLGFSTLAEKRKLLFR